MTARKQAAEQQPATIEIPLDEAYHMLEMYDSIVAADALFKRCQSDNFRQHVQQAYQAENIKKSFLALSYVLRPQG